VGGDVSAKQMLLAYLSMAMYVDICEGGFGKNEQSGPLRKETALSGVG